MTRGQVPFSSTRAKARMSTLVKSLARPLAARNSTGHTDSDRFNNMEVPPRCNKCNMMAGQTDASPREQEAAPARNQENTERCASTNPDHCVVRQPMFDT